MATYDPATAAPAQVLPFEGYPSTGTPVTAPWLNHVDEVLTTAASFDGRRANNPGPLEGMLLYAYGHSWLATTSNNTTTGAGGNFGTRLAARKSMTFTNRATSGIRLVHAPASSSLIRSNVLAGSTAWTPNTRGCVLFCCTINDVSAYGTSTAHVRSYEHAVRTFLAVTRSKAKVAAASADFVYSANWTSSSTSALTSTNRFETATTGSYTEFKVVGTAVDILLTLRASANGTYTVASDGSTVTTVSSMNTTMGVDYGAAIISLSGLGSGTHTIRVTLTSGSWLGVDAAFVPSETPPPVIIVAEGALAGSNATTGTNMRSTWIPVLQSVTGEFANAIFVDTETGWDETTMLREDGLHPNDRGASYLATTVLDSADASVNWGNGLNVLTTAPSYSAPSAPSTPSGGQNGLGVGG